MNGPVPVNYVLKAFLNLQLQNNLRGEGLSLCMWNKFNKINLDIYIYTYINLCTLVQVMTDRNYSDDIL